MGTKVIVQDWDLENVATGGFWGFFSSRKEKLVPGKRYMIEKDDLSIFCERTDDFGTRFCMVAVEDDCGHFDFQFLYVKGTIEEVAKLIGQ